MASRQLAAVLVAASMPAPVINATDPFMGRMVVDATPEKPQPKSQHAMDLITKADAKRARKKNRRSA